MTPGSHIGDYEVIRLLGKGGMGEVYLARDARLGRQVALKMLPAELREDDSRRRRFLREAKLASRLVHPNAAVIYEVGCWNGGDFLAMEFVAGEPLDRRLTTGPMPTAELLEVSAQLADVLSSAHERGIIHRDVKPSNVVLTPEGQVKLLDFGVARMQASAVTDQDSTLSAEVGIAVGTVAYMSPEQAMGQEVDARSDVFSLGVVFYEMATGKRPFGGANYGSTLAKILQQDPPPMERWNAAMPAEYERIVRKCLEKERENRYQSAREIRIDLRNLQRGGRPEAPRLGRRMVLAGGAVSAAVALGAGTFYWSRLPRVRSLAVLPLGNAGAQELAYLADGLTENLINEFSRAQGLRVLARSTVYNRNVPAGDPVAAGKRLGVDAVITGKVTPRDDQFEILVRLIDTADGSQRWGRTVLVAPPRLAAAAGELARQALVEMGRGPGAGGSGQGRPVDADAYQAYLRGRYQMNKRTRDGIEKAIEYFREAQDHDAAYALPYAGLATAYTLKSGYTLPKDVFPLAQSAAQHALELDPSLPEAHGMLGVVRLYYQWDWAGSESEIKRALELNPNYASGHSNYSQYLICRKRFEDAVGQVKRSTELDPLSSTNAATLGYVYYQARRFNQAIAQLSKAIDTDKNSPIAYFYRGTTYLAMGKYDQSIADFDAGLKLAPDNGAIADQGMAYARAGNVERAREAIRKIEASGQQRYVSPHLRAFPYIGLGELDRAMDCIEQAAEDRSFWVVYLGVEPKLDAVRSHARFQQLMKLVGV